MALQSTINLIESSLTFPSTKAIATKQHMAVWVFNPDIAIEAPYFGWQQVNVLDYDLVNNSAVINNEAVLAGMTLVEVRVADNPDELEYAPTVIAIIAGIAQEIVIVACMAYEIVVVANNITSVQICAENIVDINVCAENIQEIKDAPVYSEAAKQAAWIAEAEALTSDSYATEPEDIEVKEYTSNGDGTFTATTIVNQFSSYHYMKKNEALQGGLHYVGDWDASLGVYPATRPPNGAGAPLELSDSFIVTVNGTIDSTVWEEGDWMIYDGVVGDWTQLRGTNDWSDLTNIPNNVTNAITDVELQAGLATKPTGSWSYDGSTLAIVIP